MSNAVVLAAEEFVLDTGNTAWILTSATLVLMMTVPALAFFYGGLVRAKSVLNMMMLSFGVAAVVGIVWVLWGFSMAFGSDVGGIIGKPGEYFALHNIEGMDGFLGGVPGYVFVGFQATFAIITVALISGSLADRVRFGPWLAFVALWATLVYFPLCHWVWGGGFLGGTWFLEESLPAPIDFAGGTVVHINAGMAGLVLAIIIGKRKGFGKEPMRPHNVPFVMLGAALLWIGWFGFNAGSAGAADAVAGLAWVNTTVATCGAMLGWILTERIKDGKPTSVGAASGVVGGLVAITPAAATVSPFGAIILGFIAGILCALAVSLKYKLGYDDSLDVVGVHLVGGLTGTVLIGFLSVDNGLFYGHGPKQLVTQIIAAAIAVAYSGVVTGILGLLVKVTLGWRVTEAQEVAGIDLAEHGETGYETVGTGRSVAGI